MKNNTSFDNLLQLAAKESFKNKVSSFPPDEELVKMYGKQSERHKKKMTKILKSEKRKENISYLVRRFSKTYMISSLCFVFFFSTLLSAEAVRESISITLIDWKDKFVNIFIESEYSRDKLPDITISYVPEGFTLISTIEPSAESKILNYENNQSDYLIIHLSTFSQNFTDNIDNEFSNYYSLKIYGDSGTWIQQGDKNILIIAKNGIFYNITGTILIEEIVEIYKNIIYM